MEGDRERAGAWMSSSDNAGGQSASLNINENRNKALKRLIQSANVTCQQNTHHLGVKTGVSVNGFRFVAFTRGNRGMGILH